MDIDNRFRMPLPTSDLRANNLAELIRLRRPFSTVAPLIAGNACRHDIAAPIGAALCASDQMLCRTSKTLRLFACVPRAHHEFSERFDRRVPELQSAIEAGLRLCLRG
jgi:hypothetical protein